METLAASVDERARFAEDRARHAEVLSIVSHDIRGPLGVILVAVSELLDGRVGALTEEQRGLVQLVRRSSERLSRLAANVSFLEKTVAGEPALAREPADLRDVARRAVQSFERSGEIGKRVRVTLHVPDERVGVAVDAELAGQACVNVLANAIRVARNEIHVTVALDDGTPVILVDDDGPGVAPQLQPTLFEPDRRPIADRDPRGLGLPIVHGIVRAHGGSVSAENRTDAAVPGQPERPVGARIRIVFGPQL